MRTTSGSWRVHKDFPNLPAWIVKSVGGSTVHWAGASLRFQEHEFKTTTTYGEVPGANLLDWPISLQEMEPWYAKAEDKMGVTRTNNIPGPARQQQLQGARGRREQARLQGSAHRPHGDQQRSRATAAAPASRSASASRAASRARNGRRSTPRSRRARRPASSKCGRTRMALQIEHDASRQGHRRGLFRHGRQAAAAEGARRRGRRQFAGKPAAAAELRVARSSPTGSPTAPGQVGRNYMRHMTG